MGKLIPLSDDEFKRLAPQGQSTSVSETPPTTEPKVLKSIPLDDVKARDFGETPVFNGSTYKPGGNANPANQEIYNNTGEKMFPDWVPDPINPRVQKTVDNEGRKSTQFVPNANAMAGDANSVVGRTLVGGGLKAAKGTLGFGEWALDTIIRPQTVKLANGEEHQIPNPVADGIRGILGIADHMLGSNLSDTTVNSVDENFATLPGANDLENTAQEVVSMIAGAVGGGGVASKIDDIAGMSRGFGQMIAGFWDQATKINPKNAQRATELFVKGLIVENGANVGSTALSPRNSDTISQDGVKVPFVGNKVGGFLPEQIGGLSKDESTKVGQFADNTMFSAAMGTVFKSLGLGKDFIANKFFDGAKDASSRAAVARQILQDIDPNVKGISDEQLAVRTQILADVLEKHAVLDSGLPGVGKSEIDANTVMALKEGSREYVEKAYEFRKASMPADEYKALVDKEAAEVLQNMINMKRTRLGRGDVQVDDARINSQIEDQLSLTADKTATREQSMEAGNTLGQRVIDQTKQIQDTLNLSQSRANTAKGALEVEQNKNVVLQEIERMRAGNELGSTSVERAAFNKMSTEQLYDAWSKAKANVNAKYAAIPDAPISPQEAQDLAGFLKGYGDREHVLGLFLKDSPNNPFPSIGDDVLNEAGETVSSPISDLVTKMLDGGMSAHDLYSEVRPALAKRINALNPDGKNAALVQPLTDLKKFIDGMVMNGPANQAAKEADAAYKQFAGTWKDSNALEPFHNLSRANSTINGPLNPTKQAIAGVQALQAVLDDTTGLELPQLVKALDLGGKSGAASKQGLAQIVYGKVIKSLVAATKAGKEIPSEQLRSALAPYYMVLQDTDPKLAAQLQEAVTSLSSKETAAGNATVNHAAIVAKADEATAAVRENVAAKFVSDNTKDPQLLSNPAAGFNSLFSDKEAPTKVAQLMAKTDDQTVKDGIKGQALRWLKEKAFTNNPIGTGTDPLTGTVGMVPEVAKGRLGTILRGETDNTLLTLRAVFADDPVTMDGIETLLKIADDHVNLRATKANPFGSSTTMDLSNKLQQNVSVMTRIIYGSLNHTATLINAVSGVITRARSEQMREAAEWMIDQTIIDPKFFAKSLRLVSQDASGQTFGRWLKSSGYNLNKAVVGASKGNDQDTIDQQTQKAFNPLGPSTNERNNSRQPIDVNVNGGNPNAQ